MDVHANMPRLIPVLDVMGGQVVHAVAGNRKDYKPLVSQLTNSTVPIVVARAIRDKWRTNELYIADLDAILGGQPATALFVELLAGGFRCWVDAGRGFLAFADLLKKYSYPDAGIVVLGLESAPSHRDLPFLLQVIGPSCFAFSLDLRDGRPLGDPLLWSADAESNADAVIEAGMRKLIVLDLSRVGVGEGVGTEKLCASIKSRHPNVELIAGGGVRGPDDVRRLHAAGVSAVLVASALHDLRLTPDNWPS